MTPTDYVLDGQQRITVIYSSLGAPFQEEGFAPAYDLRTRQFISLEEADSPVTFPLRWIYNTTKLLDFRTGLQTHHDAPDLQSRLDELVDAFSKYKLPVVTLKDLTVEEVCPIFERINSSGTKLSTYDLMVAATWSQEFDLNGKVDEIAQGLRNKNFHKIDPDTILKCLAAVQFSSITQGQIINLRQLKKDVMSDLVRRTKEALLQAVDLLATEFGIYSWDFLPYEAVLIILCHLCAKAVSPSAIRFPNLRQWFWRSAFSQRYRVGGENFVSKDLADVGRFVINGHGKPSDFGIPPQPTVWLRLQFRANNSISSAYALALASLKPCNLTNGALIDVSIALSQFNKKEFHHIYPRAFLKGSDFAGEANAIANICMLASSENKVISDEDPRLYLPKLIDGLGSRAESVFRSNALPPPTKFLYDVATFEEFLTERSEIIAKLVNDLCGV